MSRMVPEVTQSKTLTPVKGAFAHNTNLDTSQSQIWEICPNSSTLGAPVSPHHLISLPLPLIFDLCWLSAGDTSLLDLCISSITSSEDPPEHFLYPLLPQQPSNHITCVVFRALGCLSEISLTTYLHICLPISPTRM